MIDIYKLCKYIIKYEEFNNRNVNPLKLQKILYFLQVYFLTKENRKCFSEEIEAWNFGPIISKVYEEYKFFGSIGISITIENDLEELVTNVENRLLINELLELIATNKYNFTDLTHISMNQDPWINAYEKNEKNIISDESIKKYFYRKIN